MCLFDFVTTNVEGTTVVSKKMLKKICGYQTAVRSIPGPQKRSLRHFCARTLQRGNQFSLSLSCRSYVSIAPSTWSTCPLI